MATVTVFSDAVKRHRSFRTGGVDFVSDEHISVLNSLMKEAGLEVEGRLHVKG
jgi:hypothetical protein